MMGMILIEAIVVIYKLTVTLKNVLSFYIPTTIDIEMMKWQTRPISFGSLSYELKIHPCVIL